MRKGRRSRPGDLLSLRVADGCQNDNGTDWVLLVARQRHYAAPVRARTAQWALAVLLAIALHGPLWADKPSDGALVGAGLGMAVPTYFLGVAVHEGSHALAARMVGARVIDIDLLPHVHRGKFYFGRVMVVGLRSRAQRNFFLMAPKISDAILLGGYSVALGFDVLPENRYGLLALTVVATGFWVDFTRDVFAFWDHNDTVKIYNSYGLDNEWKRLPPRLVHAGISVAAALVLAEGYRRVFADDNAATAMARLGDGRNGFALPLLTLQY